MKNTITALTLCLTLTACGTTTKLTMSDRHSPIPAGKSRLIFERNNSLMYAGASADVKVDGETVGKLGMGGEAMALVKAGQHTLNVSTPGGFGTFTKKINAQAGRTYTYEVSPNPSAGKLLGGAIYDALTSDTNGGYFKLEDK